MILHFLSHTSTNNALHIIEKRIELTMFDHKVPIKDDEYKKGNWRGHRGPDIVGAIVYIQDKIKWYRKHQQNHWNRHQNWNKCIFTVFVWSIWLQSNWFLEDFIRFQNNHFSLNLTICVTWFPKKKKTFGTDRYRKTTGSVHRPVLNLTYSITSISDAP